MKTISVWLLLLCASLTAAEGMWTLDQLLSLNLDEQGLAISTEELWNQKDGGISKAVISLGGCTASFISPNGLIVTNHHCAYGALQRNSTAENNILENGFNATSLDEELPTYGTEVYVLQSFEDVTDRVLSAIRESMTPEERAKAIDQKIIEIEESVESADSTLRATVAAMYSGQSYVLFKHLHIKDVRLVYAPPKDVGKFGGDIDNFEWPRHTGDWSLMRAYVGPDGQPAEPDSANVPYHPEKWLTVSTQGYEPGDLNMVIGYPGRTSRYRTSYSIDYLRTYYYPWRLDMLHRTIALIEERALEDKDAAIKLESLLSGLNNSLKNSQGQYDGFKRTHLYEKKVELENEFREKMQHSPELQQKYSDVLPAIKEQYADYKTYEPKRYLVSWMSYVNDVYSAVNSIYRYSKEKQKPETERRPGYTDKDMKRAAQRWTYGYRNYDEEFDKRVLALFFELAHELPENMKIHTIEAISGDKTGDAQKLADAAFIENLYTNTQFTKLEEWQAGLEKSQEELDAMNDPFINFVAKLQAEMEPLYDRYKTFEGAMTMLRPRWIEAITADRLTYPDANGTKRLTYGVVKGYSPRDAVWYKYFTTTDGILEKYTGAYPFNSPEKQLEEIKAKDFGTYRDATTGKMHINFLNTLDTTGGNSGSPVLNNRGQLIGLLFDGNYESIVADYIFDADLTRSICVDIRYMLWYMSTVDDAQHLLTEMDFD